MKKLYLLLFVGFLMASCNKTPAQQKYSQKAVTASNITTQLKYYTYGLPEPYFARAEEAVFAKYGVVVQRVAGCEVDENQIKDVKAHNDSLFVVLDKKYSGLTEDQVLQEMQHYVTITKAIEATIDRTLHRKIKALNPGYYTNFNWKEDSTKGQYLVDLYANRYESKQADTLLWQLKVVPATDYILIKTKEGQWNECIK